MTIIVPSRDVTVQLTTDQLSLFYYQFSGDSVFAGLTWQQVPTMVFTMTSPLVLRNVSQGHQVLQVSHHIENLRTTLEFLSDLSGLHQLC